MDPTTLFAAVLIALGLLGTDAVMYSGSVQVEVAAPPEIKGISIDRPSDVASGKLGQSKASGAQAGIDQGGGLGAIEPSPVDQVPPGGAWIGLLYGALETVVQDA